MKFSNVADAAAFVRTLPAITADNSAWAGVSEESLASCVELGVMKFDEFKLASAKAASAAKPIAAIKKESAWKEFSAGLFGEEADSAYKAMKDAQALATASKVDFEKAVAASLGGSLVEVGFKDKNGKQGWALAIVGGKVPAGSAMQIGYNYGKLTRRLVADQPQRPLRPAGSKGSSSAARSVDELFA